MSDILGLFEKLESRNLTVWPTRCVTVRNRNAECRQCIEACPAEAITVGENKLTVTFSLCVECGACAVACPSAAFEMQRPNERELLVSAADALRANDGIAVIVCEQMLAAADGKVDLEKVAGVKCLSCVDESIVVVLAALGARAITLVSGPCEECSLKQGRDFARSICATASTLLDAWGVDTDVSVVRKLPASLRLAKSADFDAGRRRFLSTMCDEARSTVAVAADHMVKEKLGLEQTEPKPVVKVSPEGVLPHMLPERRGRLLCALESFGDPRCDKVETPLFGCVSVDADACTSCRMCATFCPTGALRPFGDASGVSGAGLSFGVDHHSGLCVQCGCCEDICPTGALTVSPSVSTADIVRKGRSARIAMSSRRRQTNSPSSIAKTMGDLLGVANVYER